MRLHYVLLFVAGAFFGRVKANSMATSMIGSQATLADSLTDGNDDGPVLRFLRSTVTARVYNDERTSSLIENAISRFKKILLEFKIAQKKTTSKVTEEAKITEAKITEEANISEKRMALWRKDRLTSRQVFVKLGLDKVGDKLFENWDVYDWILYTNAKNSRNPRNVLYATVREHYSDDAVCRILVAAKNVKAMEELAEALQEVQMREWKLHTYTVDYLFKQLKFDIGLDDLLANPILPFWTNYRKAIEEDPRIPRSTFLEVLRNNYKEEDLFNMFEVAKQKADTKELATNLQNEQKASWRRFSADQVFNVYGLHRQLANPNLLAWFNFVKYSLVMQDDLYSVAIKSMMSAYDPIELIQALINAKKVPEIEEVATSLQTAFFTSLKEEPPLEDIRDWIQLGVSSNIDEATKIFVVNYLDEYFLYHLNQ